MKKIFSYLISKTIKKIIINKSNENGFEDQFVVFANDLISSEIILNKYYEKNILMFLKYEVFNKYINKDDMCIDVGANIGNHTNFFANFFLKVFSFEANKKTFDLLQINTKSKKNVSIFNYALSDSEKNINFYENKKNYGASKVVTINNEKKNKNIKQIKTKTFDKIVIEKNIKNIKYIKIDTEDHDINVLKGAENYLKNNSPFISIELKKYDFNKEYNDFEIILLLRKFGYKYFYNILEYKNQDKYKNFFIKAFNFIIYYNKSGDYYIEKINKLIPKDYEFLFISKNKI